MSSMIPIELLVSDQTIAFLPDSLAPFKSAIVSLKILLQEFAQDQVRFYSIFNQSFGNTFDANHAETIRLQWANGDFSQIPPLLVLDSGMEGMLGAYASSTNRIYLSQSLIETGGFDQITSVLLEEIGHSLDAQLNTSDTPGDEGELFSALVRGETITAEQLTAIQTENDAGVITVNGQSIAVEMASTNDNFANRIILSGSTVSTTGSNVGATGETGEPAQSGTTNSVWWSWTAPTSGQYIIDTIGSNFDTYLFVFTGSTLSTLSLVASDDDSGGSNTSLATINATAGVTYQISVDGYNSYTGAIQLNIKPVNVNTSPTDLALSATNVNENVAAGTIIGTFTSTDPDAGNTFTYSLVSGTGSTDNAAFSISGNSLLINSSPDFETKSSYSVRVRTTDQGGLFFEKQLTISINDVNETPTNLALSATSINENVPANSLIGTFTTTDPDSGNTFTYSLVSGTGSTDNAAFTIVGNQLQINASPDFETKSSYAVRVRTTDQGGLSFEKALTININNVNETPTDLALSATSINENVAANSVIGTFTTTDPDSGNTFTYSLVSGTGSTDNTAFSIVGNQLRINTSPDFETKSSYSVRVRTTDQGGLFFEKQLTISINDVNETPTDLALSATSINENVAANSVIGTFTSTDPDSGNTFTYSLVSGTGSTDNAAFTISGNQVQIKASPDFETKSSYAVRVRTTDQGGLFFEKALTISINDVNETPTNLALSATSINENVPANSVIGTFTTTDPDAGNTFTYSLVSGTGSTDNAAFSISGNSLLINSSPDFETKSSYAVRVRTTDQGGLSFEKALTININNVNEAPTDLAFSENAVNLSGGYVSLPSNTAFNISTNRLTVEAWIKPNFTNAWEAIIAKGDSAWRLARSSTSNSLEFAINTTSGVIYVTGTGNVNDGQWHHVAGVYDGTNVSLYIDGVLNAQSSPGSRTFSTNTYNVRIGSNEQVAGSNYTGQIDEVRVWNVAQTQAQILANKDISISPTSGLIGYWKFNEGTGTLTADASGNNNNGTLTGSFNWTVNNLAPTNINENVPAGTTIGTFTTTDPDAGNTFTYSLVSGTGSTDNAAFSIVGNQLRINSSPNFEVKPSYAIRVRTTDQGGLTFEKALTINVNDINETPTNLSLSPSNINENVPGNSVVGSFSTIDQDAGNTFTYSLVSGTGSTDNSLFSIVGNQLQIKISPDFETKSTYNIRVRTTDQGGLSFEKPLTININDVNEAPVFTDIALMLKDIKTGSLSSASSNFTSVNGILYFTADNGINGTELWKSDGTAAGTVLLKDIRTGSISSAPSNLTNINGTLYFTADDGINGRELWKSDGKASGTVLVANINPGSSSSNPSNITNVDGILYFRAANINSGEELWKSDGTAAGTVLVKDIWVGSTGSSYPSNLTNINGTLYFAANDGINGRELWKTDGTTAGTVMVKNIRAGSKDSSIYNLTNVNGTLYFTADDGINGIELWKSDGTEVGTVIVKNIATGSNSSNPANLTDVNGILYFTADDGTNGIELWKSDGTDAGTVIVQNINPAGGSSSPNNLTNINGTLYFTANDGINGEELWKTDGTAAGTVLVRDIRAGSIGANPSFLKNINGTLYFTADDGINGRELWKSDGTSAGTVLVQNIASGSAGSNPSNITDVNGNLYFTAKDSINGEELWNMGLGFGNKFILKNNSLSPISFSIKDPETSASSLVVTATSSNTALVSSGGIIFGGSGSNRTLRVTPLANQVGTATITVNVSDGVNITSTSFDLTVADALLSIASVTTAQLEGDNGNTPFTFTVSRTGNTTGISTVDFAVAGIGASQADAADFGGLLPTGTVTFNPGEVSKTITVNVSGDTVLESDESFSVTLINPTNGSISNPTASAVIRDDDPAPTLDIAPVNISQYEGDSGNTPFTFTVTRTGNTRRASTVDYAVTGSGANPANAADFGGTLPSGTINFASGEISKLITVNVSGDKTIEPDENFTVTLSNPTNNTTITTATATGTILYDDTPLVTLSLSPIQINEGGGSATLRATLSEPFFKDVTVKLGLFSGTATRGVDYNVVDTMVIAAGSTSVTTPISIVDDLLSEGNETFSIDIIGVVNGVKQGTQRVTGTIIDNDPPDISIVATTNSVNEDGSPNLIYTVSRTGEITSPLTVYYTTSGTATSGVDYGNLSGSVLIPAGQRTATITVDPTPDKISEPDETVTLTLVKTSQYNLGSSSSATGTILNDDTVFISINDLEVIEGTGGTKNALVKVSLQNTSSDPIIVSYATADNTATSSKFFNDFTASSGSITIPAYATEGNIVIPINSDNVIENDENFFVNLTNVSSKNRFSVVKNKATVTIVDDDTPPFPDTKDFKIEAQGKKFSYNTTTKNFELIGATVFIGRKSGNNRLIRVEGGTFIYGANEIQVINGTVYSQIGSISQALFKGNFSIAYNGAGSSSSFTDQNLANDLKIAGLNPTFTGIAIGQNDISLSGNLALPSSLGGSGLSISLGATPTKNNAMKITNSGIKLGNDLALSTTNISLFNRIPVTVPDFDLNYNQGEDTLKLQGDINIPPFFKSLGGASLQANLSGSNFIQIKNGTANLVGKISLKDLKFSDNWGVDEASLTIDTIKNLVGGDFEITFPFKPKGATKSTGLSAKFGADFYYDPFALNRLSADVPLYPGIPLGDTGLKLVSVGGTLNNLSSRSGSSIELSGRVKLKDVVDLGLEMTGSVTISKQKLAANLDMFLINPNLLKGQVNLDLDWTRNSYSLNGNVEALYGFLRGSSSLKAGMFGSYFGITASGSIEARIPQGIRWIGGQTLGSANYYLSYVKDNDTSNDFAAAWVGWTIATPEVKVFGKVIIPSIRTTLTAGVKVNFHGGIDFIGSAPARPISSFEITSNVNGTNRDWILLGADWTNPSDNVQLRVEKPDGTWIEESDFAANGFVIVDQLSDQDTRVVLIPNPDPGIWDVKVVDPTGLGTIDYSANQSTIKPTIDITSPSTDVFGGEVNIGFNAYDADSEAKIVFFYDTDNQGYDGTQLPGELIESDGAGNYVWNTQGMKPGDYYVYAMIQDDVNEPIFSKYAAGSIKVNGSVNLQVDSTISSALVNPGDEVTYSITVTNLEGDIARQVSLIEIIPDGASFISASIPFVDTPDGLVAQLGDIALGESKVVTVTIKTPAVEGEITNIASVVTNDYDTDLFNDTSALTSDVAIYTPKAPIVDLGVIAAVNPSKPNPGDLLTFVFTVTNSSDTKATGVILKGNLAESLTNLVASVGTINASKLLTANLGDIEAGQSKTITVQGIAPNNLDSIFNVLNVSSNEEDQDLVDNLLTQDVLFSKGISVLENSPTGTVVGSVVSAADNLTLSLLDNAGGRFGISGTNLVVANGSLLDYETNTNHNVTVQAVDAQNNVFTQTFNIAVRDQAVFTIDNQTITEGDTGSKTMTFTVSLTDPINAQPAIVNYATANGTAFAGYDYIATSGTLFFNPGETSKTVNVEILGDTIYEPNETFSLVLSGAGNGTIAKNIGVGTIIDNDAPVSLSVLDTNVVEGNSGTKNLLFQVGLSAVNGQQVTVNYSTSDGTATAGSDYTATSGTLTFLPGTTVLNVAVPILGDTVIEPDETFFLNISNATGGTTIAKAQGTATIINDDGLSGGLNLIGTTGNDILTGAGTNDILTGLAGADVLDGQGGADRFVYNALTDSLLGGRDAIRSFNPGEGDRIDVGFIPGSVFNVGSVGTSIGVSALNAAYAAANSNSGLAANQAVFFTIGSGRTSRLYLSVNDSIAGFNANSDLVMEVTGMIGAPSGIGALTASNYFVTNNTNFVN